MAQRSSVIVMTARSSCAQLVGTRMRPFAVLRVTGSEGAENDKKGWARDDGVRGQCITNRKRVQIVDRCGSGMIDCYATGSQGIVMRKAESNYSYTVILEAETDPEFAGYYNARVPALPGCFSYGASREEALANIKEAIVCYLEDIESHGESVPQDISACLERVKVAL